MDTKVIPNQIDIHIRFEIDENENEQYTIIGGGFIIGIIRQLDDEGNVEWQIYNEETDEDINVTSNLETAVGQVVVHGILDGDYYEDAED